jgi:hypothetical protein
MVMIELVPDLSQCIETVAKREYRNTVQILLSTEAASEEIRERAEILRLFLEAADFKKLRAESERYLIDGRQVRFTIYTQGNVSKYEMQVT